MMRWKTSVAGRILLLWAVSVTAMSSPGQEAMGPVDPAELEAFMDGVMAASMSTHRTVGATVSVVRDGQVLLAKGYGYADWDARTPVDPAKTMFRIGSVSKLFTWIAIMQLAEQGLVELDTDINTYMKNVAIPDTFPEPITLSHLMSHTPGFEDQVIGLFAEDLAALGPLDEILNRDMPARTHPPGYMPSYSNHGTAMAGLIVQDVSGMPWELYIEQHILNPLNMRYSTVRQPVPEPLQEHVSKGYQFQSGRFIEKPFELVPAGPAGSMSASAVDMAHFMIAILQDGRFQGQRILSAETAVRMRSRLHPFTNDSAGMLHGFFEVIVNGQYGLGHGGDTLWFHSMLAVIPEHNLGIFVSCNSDTGGKTRNDVMVAFVNHYFPVEPVKLEPAEPAALRDFAGTYGIARMSSSTLAKVGRLLGMGVVRLKPDGSGYLLASGLDEHPIRFARENELILHEAEGQRRLVFRAGDDGRPAEAVPEWIPVLTLERLRWHERQPFHIAVFGVCIAVFLAVVIGQPVSTLVARMRRTELVSHHRQPTPARAAAWIMSALFLAFVAGFAVTVSDPMTIIFGMPAMLKRILWLPLAAAPVTALCAGFAIASWARGYGSITSRTRYTVVVLTGLVFLWWLSYWNLYGHHYPNQG